MTAEPRDILSKMTTPSLERNPYQNVFSLRRCDFYTTLHYTTHHTLLPFCHNQSFTLGFWCFLGPEMYRRYVSKQSVFLSNIIKYFCGTLDIYHEERRYRISDKKRDLKREKRPSNSRIVLRSLNGRTSDSSPGQPLSIGLFRIDSDDEEKRE